MSLIRAGAATPRVPIYKSESYKLHQAFEPAAGQTILPGYAVGLDATGKIFQWKGTGTYLGIATTKTNAYGEITVMVQGYAIIHGVSAGELVAGYVNPGDPYTGKTDYLSYSQSGQTTPAVKASSIQTDKYKIEAVVAGAAGNSLTYTVAVDGTGEATVVKTDNNIAITLLSTAKTVGDLIALLAANTSIRATLNGSATNSTTVTAVSSPASLSNGADAITTAIKSDFILLTPATAAGQVVPILVK